MSDENDERREYSRYDSPYLIVQIGGMDYSSVNWSYGGMMVTDYAGDLRAGALLDITRMGPVERKQESVSIKARVVRADPASGLLAISFLHIDQAAYDMLSSWHA